MIRAIMANLVLAISFPALAQTFHGYPCTQDCSGHEAGYRWAERKDITSEFDCGSDSNSFKEGCRAYVEEQEDEVEAEKSGDNGDE